MCLDCRVWQAILSAEGAVMVGRLVGWRNAQPFSIGIELFQYVCSSLEPGERSVLHLVTGGRQKL
jgi:hypothetical protein